MRKLTISLLALALSGCVGWKYQYECAAPRVQIIYPPAPVAKAAPCGTTRKRSELGDE